MPYIKVFSICNGLISYQKFLKFTNILAKSLCNSAFFRIFTG